MKRLSLRLGITVLILVLLASGLNCFTVFAENPYDSYTYWTDVGSENKAVHNRSMYNASFVLDAKKIGVSEFNKINDICTDKNGQLYILDNNSRIIVLNQDYSFKSEIGSIGKERYDGAASLYVAEDETVFICDTEGHRILHINKSGQLIETVTLPDSPLIPENFDFRPTDAAIDSEGNLYVLSDGSFYGALLYAPDKSFLGFFGANTVTSSVSDVFANIISRMFPNNAKKGNTAQRLPYCFVGIDVDKNGFVYTCNGYTKAYNNIGQIRKLSPGTGGNILNSNTVNFTDAKINRDYKNGAMAKQDILDIAVDSNGFIYGLESAFGRVFMYDSSCRTLTAFGGGMGEGSKTGNFVTASSIALNSDSEQVLIADSSTNLITVFSITDFGKKVKQLITLTLKGDYIEAKDGWEEIIALDNSFQPAYSGLSRAFINEGDYKTAMKYAKTGYDRESYGIAFEALRKDFIDNNFVLLFIGAVLIVAGVITFLIVSTRKKLVFIKNKQINLMLSTLIHPSDTFTLVKEKQQGSVTLSLVTVGLFYVSTVLQTLAGGFLFTIYDATTFNSLMVLVRSVGLVVLWVIADWMVCTLLGGKGKLREIIIVTCYSLWPLIIKNLLSLLLTNVLLPAEAGFLTILEAIAVIYFVLLMIVGLLKIHDFSFSRLIGTSILAILGIAAIVFLLIMIIILIQQLCGFVFTLITEIITL